MPDWPSILNPDRHILCTGGIQSVGQDLRGFLVGFSASAWPAANRAIYVPFSVQGIYVCQKIFWANGTTSGNIDAGVYDVNQKRLLSIGSTAQSGATAIQSATFSLTLYPGAYFFGLVMDNGTGQIFQAGTSAAAMGAMLQTTQNTAFPLPDPAVMVAAASGAVPLMGITNRSFI